MSSTCAELPTVEECRAGADAITDERLWSCVRSQCTSIEIRCGVEVRKECRRRSVESGGTIMGFTLQKRGMTFFYSPVKEV